VDVVYHLFLCVSYQYATPSNKYHENVGLPSKFLAKGWGSPFNSDLFQPMPLALVRLTSVSVSAGFPLTIS
jgi:hypothetical protein